MIDEQLDNPQSEIEENESLEQDLRDELAQGIEEIENQDGEELEQPELLEQEIVEELPPLEPNDLWDENTRTAFNSIGSRDGQQAMIDIHKSFQTGFNEKFQGIADDKRSMDSYNQALAPLDNYLRVSGLTREQGIGMFSQHMQNIMQDPINGSKAFLSSLGVDVSTLIPQENDEYVDPQFSQMQTQLQQQNQQLQQYINNQQSQVQAQQTQAWQGQINGFINQTNEQGHLQYPRFNELRGLMGQLMNSGIVQDGDLVQAYQKADNLNPTQAPQTVNTATQNQVKKSLIASKNIKSKGNSITRNKISQRDELRRGLEAAI